MSYCISIIVITRLVKKRKLFIWTLKFNLNYFKPKKRNELLVELKICKLKITRSRTLSTIDKIVLVKCEFISIVNVNLESILINPMLNIEWLKQFKLITKQWEYFRSKFNRRFKIKFIKNW